MELLNNLLQRNVVIGLAVCGGLVALLGNVLLRKSASIGPRTARFVLQAGYALSWLSVALFIVLGFRGPD